MSYTYEAVVIDFFGVICSEIAPHWLIRYFPPAQATEIKADIVHAADVGQISQSAMFAQLAELAGVTAERAETEWNNEVRIDNDLVDLLRVVQGSYKLGLLTNSPSPFVRGILLHHELTGLFRAIVVSSEIGAAKPQPEPYERVLHELSIAANAAVFIDDNPVNVAAAAKIGMKGVLYRSIGDILGALPLTEC